MDFQCKENAKSSYKSNLLPYIAGCYADVEAAYCLPHMGHFGFSKIKMAYHISHTELRNLVSPNIFYRITRLNLNCEQVIFIVQG